MENINADTIKRLKHTLNYIIERDDDFGKLSLDRSEDREEISYIFGMKDCSNFYIFVNNALHDICCYTMKNEARNVLSYIKDIQYIYDFQLNWDSIVGDVDEFLESIGRSELIDYHYMEAVKELNGMFTKNEIKDKIHDLFKRG